MPSLDSYIFHGGMEVTSYEDGVVDFMPMTFQLILNPEADPKHLQDAASALTQFLAEQYRIDLEGDLYTDDSV